MSFPIQNYRSSTPGLQPPSLFPGQIFINLADKVQYIGNGTSYKTAFDGSQTVGVPGEGWFATPLSLEGLSGDFIVNPETYGDIPSDGQVLTWDGALGHVVWADGGGGAISVYQFTNAEMIAAAGNTATEKLNSLTGGCSGTGSIAIVSGNPGDIWQGDYFCNGGAWFFGANYAWPTAAQVVYTPSGDLTATNVQAAIDQLEAEKVESPTNTPTAGQVLGWNGTETQWVNGGGGTGSVNSVSGTTPIVVDNADPANPIVQVTYANTVSSGVVTLNDTVTSTDNTKAATAGAVKIANDAAVAAQSSATQAIADAAAAQSTANTANTAAAAAQTTANQAITDAAAAQSTADTANTAAAAAQSTANTAQTVANQAVTDAAAAAAAAATADGKAVNAQNTANQAIADAAAAAADAATKLPLAGGTLTGTLNTQTVNVPTGYSIEFNGGAQGSINAISNSTTFTSDTTAASSTAVKSAYDLATTANTTANTALTKANSDLVAPTTTPNAGDYIRYDGTTNTWSSIYAVTATVNTFYANENVTDIQPLVDATSVFGQIIVAAGAYNGATLTINDKQTLSISGVDNPTGAVNALIGFTGGRDVVISGATSQRIRLTNLAIYGDLLINGTQGRHYFKNVTVTGQTSISGTTGFLVFENCTFSDGVVIDAAFSSTATFVNCNFDGTTVASGASPLQVIYSNCVNLSSFPVNTTGFGFNALSTGVSKVDASQFLQSGVDIGALAIGALPRATYQALGDMVVGATGGVPTRFPVSPNLGYILAANPASPFGMEWVVNAADGVQSVTGTAPITVDNTDPVNPVIGVSAASTTAPGVVQLVDSTVSTSTTEALTANQGKLLQDQINALANISNLTLAGTINASTGLVDGVTTKGAAEGFVLGSALPAPSSSIVDFFVIVDVPGTMTPTGGSTSQACDQGDWWYCDGTAWVFFNVGVNVPLASTTVPGIVQLATDAEVQAGVNTLNAVVPSALQSKISDSIASTSSTTIASSAAVKIANDAGQLGIANAAAAQTTANQAVTDAAAAQTTANSAQADATQALANAALAQADATSALNNAATAQSTANTALANAATAQTAANAAQADATQALTNAAAAQTTADAALPKAGGTMTGDIVFAPTQTFPATATSTNTQVIYNNNGVLTGNANLTFSNTSNTLTLVNLSSATGAGNSLNLVTPDSLGPTANPINILPGGGAGGGAVNITGGSTELAGVPGGFVNITGGSGIPGTPAGEVVITGGTAGTGGDVTITSGNALSTGSAGNVIITAGTNVNSAPGSVNITEIGQAVVGSSYTVTNSTDLATKEYVDTLVGGSVDSVTGTAPITVDNTDPANPVVGINAASTTVAGAVQLNDTVTSTSVTEAATANAAKVANDAAVAAQSTANTALANAATAQTTADNAATAAANAQATADAALVAPVPAGVAGQFITYNGTANTWTNINSVTEYGGSTYYANQAGQDIQTVLDALTPGTLAQIYFAAGYNFDGPDVAITDQVNINITGPETPTGTYIAGLGSTAPRGLVISGATSTRVRLENIQIKGLTTINGTQGRHLFRNVSFGQGVTFTGATTNFIGFENCIFSGPITIPNTFAGSVTFTNCNFNGQTITSNTPSPAQVIITNGANLPSLTTPNVTFLGTNSDVAFNIQVFASEFSQGGVNIGDLAIGALPKSTYTTLGDLVVGGASGVPTRFPVSTTAGYILSANPAAPLGIEWIANSADGVLSVTGAAPITVDNTDPANPVVGVNAASTTAAGVVQLSDSVATTSSTQAATSTAVKTANDAAVAAQADATAALTKANSDLVAPLAAPNAGDLIEYSGTANVWSSKYDLNALVNTIYCNVGVKDVQIAINEAVAGTPTQISLGAGSYLVGTYPTNGVVVDACDNLTIAGPSAPESAYSAQIGDVVPSSTYRNFTIQNGSVYFNLKDLAIKGNLYINGTQLKSYFDNVTVVGRTVFQGVNTNFIFFENCNFTDDITVNAQFAGQAYFVNCTFNNNTVNISTTNPQQVILINCNGLSAFPSSTVATLVGFNSLDSGVTVSNAQQYLQSGTDIGALAIGALQKSGGTMTGLITFAAGQTFPGIVPGSNYQIPFNIAGAFTASANFTFNNSTNTLTVPTLSCAAGVGGSLNIVTPNSVGPTPNPINIIPGTGAGGGSVNIKGGDTQLVGVRAGDINITGGGGVGALQPGRVFITGGAAGGGGDVVISGGNGTGSGSVNAGDVTITSGTSGNGIRGFVNISEIATAIVGPTYTVTDPEDLTTKAYVDNLINTGAVQSVTGTGAISVDNTDPLNPVVSVASASTTTAGVVQIGSNINVAAGVISVSSASTTTPGISQLNDTTSSIATDQALTAAQGKNLQDQINVLSTISNLVLTGTVDASTGLLSTVTAAGTTDGFVVGSPLPTPTNALLNDFVIVSASGTMTPTGGTTPQACKIGDWWYCDGAAWVYFGVGFTAPYATTTEAGLIELATAAEVQDGLNTTLAVVPSTLQSKISDSTSTTSSTTIASSTAVKSAYDLATTANTAAAAAQATADAALPKAGGTMTGAIVFAAGQTFPGVVTSVSGSGAISITGTATDPIINVASASTTVAGVVQLNDTVSSTSVTEAATANAVKTANDAAVAAQGTADAALPKAGGTMTGNITFNAGQTFPGVVVGVTGTAPISVDNTDPTNPVISISAASTSASGVVQLSDSVSTTSSVLAATSTAVKTANDAAVAAQTTANAALVAPTTPAVANQFLTYNGSANVWSNINSVTQAFGATRYANQAGQDIQTVLDSLTPGDLAQIIFAAGYNFDGATVAITDQVNINITGPQTPTGTYMAGLGSTAPRGLTISGATSTRVRIENLQIKGLVTIDGTLGRHSFYNVSFDQGLTVTGATSGFLQFENCNFGGPIVIPATFASGATFNNCNFNGQTITSNAASPAQVIITNAANLQSLSIPNVTLLGTNADSAFNVQVYASQFSQGGTNIGNLAIGALQKSGGTMTGAITFAPGQTFPGTGTLTGITGSAPVVIDNTNPAVPAISVSAASTTASGVVQLNDSTTSTSTTEAATANAVKTAADAAAAAQVTASAALPKAGGTMTGNIVFNAGQTFPGTVVGVTGTGAISVNNADPANPVVSVATATSSALGVVQVGSNINVTSGTISVPEATSSSLGVVQAGANIDVAAGVISVPTATNAALGVVSVGSNINLTSGAISVASASTTTPGIVQLADSTASQSTTQALTANQGYLLQQEINALSNVSNLSLSGTINASTGLISTVTAAGTADGFVVGNALPTPTSALLNDFVIVDTAGTMTPTGGSTAQTCKVGDWWYCDGTAWVYFSVGYTATAASTTTAGVVQLATDAEVQAGTNTTKAVVPSALQSKLSDSTSTTSSTTIASSTAVKAAFDQANTKLSLSGGTMTGNIVFNSGQTFPGAVANPSNTPSTGGVLSYDGTATTWTNAIDGGSF